MNEEQYAKIVSDLAANGTEHGSFRRRLDEHDDKIEKLQQTQIVLERLTNAVNNLSNGVGELKATVQRVDTRVATLEQEPADKWKKVTAKVLELIIAAAVGYAISVIVKGA